MDGLCQVVCSALTNDHPAWSCQGHTRFSFKIRLSSRIEDNKPTWANEYSTPWVNEYWGEKKYIVEDSPAIHNERYSLETTIVELNSNKTSWLFFEVNGSCDYSVQGKKAGPLGVFHTRTQGTDVTTVVCIRFLLPIAFLDWPTVSTHDIRMYLSDCRFTHGKRQPEMTPLCHRLGTRGPACQAPHFKYPVRVHL